MALRGHASIQGSTDIPTLYDLLPGYLHMPGPRAASTISSDYIDAGGAERGWWSNFAKYIVSLLKAWFGDAATPENDFGFGTCRRSPATTRTSRRCCARSTAASTASS